VRKKLKATRDELNDLKARLVEGLDPDAFQKACRAVDLDLEALDQIISGVVIHRDIETGEERVRAVRNALARVKALELKWGYGYGRPAQQLVGPEGGPIEVHHRVTIIREE